jgi:protein-tyrosine-phosphatase
MIDRSQTLWSRKYALKISDPSAQSRKGFMLSVGATRGKALFDCIDMTLRYFFDAIGADFNGKLTYGGIEGPSDIKNHPSVEADIEKTAAQLAALLKKKTILFTCSQNTGRSQMAGAFARRLAGDRFSILTAGSMPADAIGDEIEESLAEKGIDLGFRKPDSIDNVTEGVMPDFVITINSGEETCINIPGSKSHIWIIEDPAGMPLESVSIIRDQIEAKVTAFLDEIS